MNRGFGQRSRGQQAGLEISRRVQEGREISRRVEAGREQAIIRYYYQKRG